MATTNSIAVTAQGLICYDGAGTFTSSGLVNTNVLIGNSTATGTANVAPPANIGTPLISNGTAGTAPVFGTCEVRGGGTGLTTLTTNQLMASGTTSVGIMQQISSGTSGQILVSNGSSSLPSFQSPSGVFTWSDISGNTTLVSGNGYFCSAALTATLPASPSEGNTITIFADTGSSVVIQANTGQVIRIGSSTSSTAGTATSATQGNSLTLVYRSATTTWNSVSSIGTWVTA